MNDDRGVKYYITRQKGRPGVYLTTRPYIPERQMQDTSRRQALPSSVSIATRDSYPQSQQAASSSPSEVSNLVHAETRQPVFNSAENHTNKRRSALKSNQQYNNTDTRRVRFSLPEESDVVYPGGQPNLRVLGEQFDRIDTQEEDQTEAHSREAPSQEQENRHRPTERRTIIGEPSTSRRQEPRPKGILKNASQTTPAENPSHRQTQAQSSLTYYTTQNNAQDDEFSQPMRYLHISRPPPLPELGERRENERKAARANHPVKLAIRQDDGGRRRLVCENSPPLPQRQERGQWNTGRRREPVKPRAAYVKSKEGGSWNQEDSVEW